VAEERVCVREILFPLTSTGKGYAEGVEFFGEKRLTSKLYGQANLSFSRTRHGIFPILGLDWRFRTRCPASPPPHVSWESS
jgi:hypothetical protein